ncbi:substrate-binding domain-containing protein [Phytohabitans sp. LJ34]|uniref:substrate-binding domain-containing protein n=1 Tax=Phytohabitans sp. LJ34 TaxID=3452217 RepID=UPI003F8B70F6
MTDGGSRRRPEFWPVVLLSVALVAVLGGWTAVTYLQRTRNDPACTDRTSLRVAAAPSVAAAAQEVAQALAARDRCLDVVVEARESAQVLRDLVGAAPAGSSPSAAPPPTAATAPPPDVWLPESTLWLRRARDGGAFQVPEAGVSVATTPVVLALDQRSAARLGWPARTPDWAALVAAERPPVPVVVPDPAVSPLGFGALVGIRALAGDRAGAAAAIMRRLAPRTAAMTGEAPPAPGGPGRAETAVVSTEQEVLRAGTPQVAVYPKTPVPGPDYPYAVLSSTGSRDAAAAFLRALRADEGGAALARHSLRTAAGAPLTGPSTPGRIRDTAYPPAPVPAAAEAAALLNAWGGVHLTARLLAVLDVSGSMAARIGPGESRLSATVKAAQGGVRLLLGATEIGLWTFSTDLDGQRDYQQIVPVGPVGPRRAEIIERLGQVRVKPNGGTGLYDTTLAAYRDAARNWTAGRINLLLVLTDGTDDNASGISRPQLLRELATLQDKRRPLPILFIGVGPDIDRAELDQIAKATGGRVALTANPAGIRQIFFTALAEFSCLPPKCRR